MLKIRNLNIKIDKKEILKEINFEVLENDMFMILGANGSGKTSIIKAIMNDTKYSGNIELNKYNIKKISLKNISKQIGVLMQNNSLEFDNTVYDIVSLGRYTYIDSMFGSLSSKDKEIIKEIMKITDIYKLKDTSVQNISGGELQRVFLSLVLVQEPNILILDEPTNHLDLKHQINIFEILDKWRKKKGRAVIAIIHDLNLAYNFGNRCLLLKEGSIISKGEITKTLTKDNLKEAYDIDVFEWMKNLIKKFE